MTASEVDQYVAEFGSQTGPLMKSIIAKRSLVINGRKTSVTLEDGFWTDLKEIAYGQSLTLSTLVTRIDARRTHSNLSSAIRIFVLEHFQNKAKRAGLPRSGNAMVASDESQSTQA